MSDPPTSELTAEERFEERFKRSQVRAAWAQVGGSIVSAIAVGVAIFVAVTGQQDINSNSQTNLLQSKDSQLSTAVKALGSDNAAERVAGLQLLDHNTASRIEQRSKTGETNGDAFSDYTTSLEILSGYLSSEGQSYLNSFSTGHPGPTFSRGHGAPPSPGLPLDVEYAADQVRALLGLSSQVNGLHAGTPYIDLSNDELYGQSWAGIDFRWLGSAGLLGADLRGADLERSWWGKGSDLGGAYLQCSDLQQAHFSRADLDHANLSGADVQGADFHRADLRVATIQYVYGDARWSQKPSGLRVLPAADWNQLRCLRNQAR
ncbi:MAG TPA: pentapeptide repeat-containing protein [Streptosporangiaceae bacterium]